MEDRRRAWIPAQKKSLHATERDTEANRQRRQVFGEQLRSIAPERLVFLDESGVSTQMTKRYARAQRGRRIAEATPQGSWKSSPSWRDERARHDRHHDRRGHHRCRDLPRLPRPPLCPQLQPGQIVIMDNLRSHKVAGVRERIEGAGASLLYLPPYSPDLNPIEKAWAKLKQQLRAAKARTAATLEQTIAELLPTIRPQDANAWFRLPLRPLHQ